MLLLSLAAALAAGPLLDAAVLGEPPVAVAGLAQVAGRDLRRTLLTCTHRDDAGDTELVYGVRLELHFVPEDAASDIREDVLSKDPSAASKAFVEEALQAFARSGWKPDTRLSTADQGLHWELLKDEAKLRIDRSRITPARFDVTIVRALDDDAVCPPYPSRADIDAFAHLTRTLERQGVTWRPAPADAATARRARLAGLDDVALAARIREGEQHRPEASLADLLAAVPEGSEHQLTVADHVAAWSLDARAAFAMEGCRASLDQATRTASPFTESLYPRSLADDPTFPLPAGTVLITLEVAANGHVTSARLPATLASDTRRHRLIWARFRGCMLEVARGLSYPPAPTHRTGDAILMGTPRGLELQPTTLPLQSAENGTDPQ